MVAPKLGDPQPFPRRKCDRKRSLTANFLSGPLTAGSHFSKILDGRREVGRSEEFIELKPQFKIFTCFKALVLLLLQDLFPSSLKNTVLPATQHGGRARKRYRKETQIFSNPVPESHGF